MVPTAKFSEADLKRLYWHSRRGMLELDLLLVPFAQGQLKLMNHAMLLKYEALLAQEDQDLFSWFTQRISPPDAQLQEIVSLVLAHNAAMGANPAHHYPA